MVSNASEDLPEPERPVMTVSRSRGIVTSTFFRLCSRAPRMTSASSFIAGESCGVCSGKTRQPVSARSPQRALQLRDLGQRRVVRVRPRGVRYVHWSHAFTVPHEEVMPHTDAMVVLTTVANEQEGIKL